MMRHGLLFAAGAAVAASAWADAAAQDWLAGRPTNSGATRTATYFPRGGPADPAVVAPGTRLNASGSPARPVPVPGIPNYYDRLFGNSAAPGAARPAATVPAATAPASAVPAAAAPAAAPVAPPATSPPATSPPATSALAVPTPTAEALSRPAEPAPDTFRTAAANDADNHGLIYADYSQHPNAPAEEAIRQVSASPLLDSPLPASPMLDSPALDSPALASPALTSPLLTSPALDANDNSFTNSSVLKRPTLTAAASPPVADTAGPAKVEVRWERRGEVSLGRECRCELVVQNNGEGSAADVAIEAYFPANVRLIGRRPQTGHRRRPSRLDAAELAGTRRATHCRHPGSDRAGRPEAGGHRPLLPGGHHHPDRQRNRC